MKCVEKDSSQYNIKLRSSSMDRYKIGSGTLSLIMERYHAGGIPIEELQMMPPKEVELLFILRKILKEGYSISRFPVLFIQVIR